MTPREYAAFMLWINSYADTKQRVREGAAAATVTAWSAFRDWYTADAVAALAAQQAALSTAAQQTTAGAAAAYVAAVAELAGVTGAGAAGTVPSAGALQVIRNAAPLTLVHTRPAEAFKHAIATGATLAEALAIAARRAEVLVLSDLSLQEREVELDMLRRLGVTEYRRIIHPELSRSGTCGLCIAAADRIYNTGELLPIHTRCWCTVMPIVGDSDPGGTINGQSLRSLYAAGQAIGGGTDRASLKELRYVVHEHGELGPVLRRDSDVFRGPGQVALENDPARAARMLRKVAPVLATMEADQSTNPAALAYQRELYDRLRAIVPDDFGTAA